jgi:hypothetical protein
MHPDGQSPQPTVNVTLHSTGGFAASFGVASYQADWPMRFLGDHAQPDHAQPDHAQPDADEQRGLRGDGLRGSRGEVVTQTQEGSAPSAFAQPRATSVLVSTVWPRFAASA